MKGGLAASIIAAEAFIEEHPGFMGAIEISATADEEAGGYGGVAYLAEQGQDGALPAAHFLVVSGGGDNGAFGAGLFATLRSV